MTVPGPAPEPLGATPQAGAPVTILVNGEEHAFAAGATIADVVAAVAEGPKGIAVACNAEVVPRSTWSATVLCAGDHIEVLTAAQGG